MTPTESNPITSTVRADERRQVTVDTGGRDDIFPGALVVWMHVPRGGYGYSWPVPAQVISHSRRPATSVRIEVTTRRGQLVRRTVDVQNLRWRM